MGVEGLKEIRKEIGLTAEELGIAIGMSPTYITRIENGNIANPSFSTIMKIAEVLANNESIKSNTIDITKYDNYFARLILSFRYNEIKDTKSYIEKNKDIKEYAEVMEYLSAGEKSAFHTLISYKKKLHQLQEARNKFKNKIIELSNTSNYEEYINSINLKELTINIININEVIKAVLFEDTDNCLDVPRVLLENICNELSVELLDNFKIIHNQTTVHDDSEFEIPEVK